MSLIKLAKVGFETVAGIGIDTMITTAANKVIPESYGAFGVAQKICIKAGSIGLTLVATKALGDVIDDYVDSIAEEFDIKAE